MSRKSTFIKEVNIYRFGESSYTIGIRWRKKRSAVTTPALKQQFHPSTLNTFKAFITDYANNQFYDDDADQEANCLPSESGRH